MLVVVDSQVVGIFTKIDDPIGYDSLRPLIFLLCLLLLVYIVFTSGLQRCELVALYFKV